MVGVSAASVHNASRCVENAERVANASKRGSRNARVVCSIALYRFCKTKRSAALETPRFQRSCRTALRGQSVYFHISNSDEIAIQWILRTRINLSVTLRDNRDLSMRPVIIYFVWATLCIRFILFFKMPVWNRAGVSFWVVGKTVNAIPSVAAWILDRTGRTRSHSL